MSTTFAAFVSTGVTIAYCCVRLRNLCPHQQVSQTEEGAIKKVLSRKVLAKLIT
jgi:hypothetical protein